MDVLPRIATLVVAFILLGLCSAARAQPGPALPLAVRAGRCEVVLPTEHADAQFYLVIGSLARQGGPFRVRVQTETAAGPEAVALEPVVEDLAWAKQVHELGERLARARQQRAPVAPYPAPAVPPSPRVFHLFTRQGSFQEPANYTAVTAEVRAVGRYCQIYVDRDQPDLAALRPTLDDAVRTFDDEIYPKSARQLGSALDVDRDGRFTLLFTSWLGRLQDGKVALGGFVRGSDFYRDLPAPFSNRCDMMYLNPDLRPGPYLRTLLAHEYTHAVIFCEHVLRDYLPGVVAQDEESWLNEGLAHLTEGQYGYSWENLEHRISAFLSCPERYPLVVADYYASGLWRSPGPRGAVYLFLRWCRDRHGPDLPVRLIQSNLAGVSNLEVATQERFAELFRQWSVALVTGMSGAWIEEGSSAPPFGRLLCGPRVVQVPLAHGEHEVQLAGTAVAYLLLHSPAAGHARVTVTAEAGAALQVSLVRLPRSSARLCLGSRETPDGKGVQLVLTAHGRAVELEDAAWERLTPTGNASADTSYRPETAALQTIHAWFGAPRLRAGETRTSTVIALPAGEEPLVWKVRGKDAEGNPVAAWCTPGQP
jgi:hypothetical protein